MIITIIVFLAAILILGVLCFRTNIVYPTIIKILGITLIMFSTIMFCVKMSGYNTNLRYEYSLYLSLVKVKMAKSDIVMMTNAGVSLLMFSSAMFLAIMMKQKKIKYLCFLIPICIFWWIYFPQNGERMYLALLKMRYSERQISYIKDNLDNISLLLLAAYIIVPYVAMYRKYRRTVLYERRAEMLMSGMIWLMIDMTFLFILFYGGLYRYVFFELNFSSYPLHIGKLNSGAVLLLPSIVMVLAMIFVIYRYAPLGKWKSDKERNILLSAKDESFFSLLHTYKNAFGSIMMYADCENDEYAFLGEETKRLEVVRMIAEEQFDKLNNAINRFKSNYKSPHMREYVDLVNCVGRVIRKTRGEVEINFVYENQPVMIYADEYQIMESVFCLVSNAEEAVNGNEDVGKEKKIVITVGSEDGFAFIEVWDNGCGIRKEDRNRIFMPFYSTKEQSDNFGLGLSFVKNVVSAHDGKIHVKSKLNLYTSIQILLEETRMPELRA